MRRGTAKWIVPASEAHDRLDRFMAALHPEETRSRIQSWIRTGRVRVNGSKRKTGYIVRAGDVIELEPAVEENLQPRPEPIPLEVLYEDKDIAVIVKPAGLVCHAGAGVRAGTLVNALLYRFGELESPDPMRPGIVHRLDKQTSGVMVVARNHQSHRSLSQQFKNRTVKKTYIALVYGRPRPAKGKIDRPIGRDSRNRKKISTRARRSRSAITHYEVIRELGPFSLTEIRIETGRTHQIRVHLASLGYPVVGDSLYAGERHRGLSSHAVRSMVESLHRPFLHSRSLEFEHPRSGQRVSFSAQLAGELTAFLADLSRNLGLPPAGNPLLHRAPPTET